MRSFQLDTKSYNEIEGILKHIAQVNDITDVESVSILLTKEASIAQFERKKEALIPLMLFGAAVALLSQDPDMGKLIEDLVMTKINTPGSGLRGMDAPEYIEKIKDIIYKGSARFTEEANKQEAQKNKLHHDVTSIDKIALEGAGKRLVDWGKSKIKNVFTNTKNFLFGASLESLASQIADLSARKQYISKDHINLFKAYILEVVSRGFKEVEATAGQPTEEQTASPQEEQAASSQTGTAPQTGAASQMPKPPNQTNVRNIVNELLNDKKLNQIVAWFQSQSPNTPVATIWGTVIESVFKLKGIK